jgi:hypothetical protein
MYALFAPPSALTSQLTDSESSSTPTKFGDLIDLVLAYMPESIFQLACRLPISEMMLVQTYKRVTDELARQLVAQKGDNIDDDSFVSHLCVHPIPSVADLPNTFQCTPKSIPTPQPPSHPARSPSTCERSLSRGAIHL